ncbi:MAG: SIMPL domain-containing protein, partial [Dehalococcoidia bacterium]
MKKGLLLITGLVLAAMLFILAGCTAPGRAPWEEGFGARPPEETARLLQSFLSGQQVGIWVSGEGRVSAVPDVALLRLGIEAQASTVAEAQRQGSEAMNGIMAALKAGGVEEKDIKTQRFSIQPMKQWVEEPGVRGRGKEIIVGYRVTNRVTAKIRKIEDAGTTIEAVAEAGGDLVRVDSISFII